MTEQAADKINSAIRECLARCYESDAPLANLAEYLIRLRSDPSWREAEVYQVESTVRRVLTRMIRGVADDRVSH